MYNCVCVNIVTYELYTFLINLIIVLICRQKIYILKYVYLILIDKNIQFFSFILLSIILIYDYEICKIYKL